ncbi:tetratricopeptide repeat protein, putative [Plasmodium vinckei vinckei]|uniref:Tetratricopeptide repeat protein, putative n=1 Tax=Plasmodium vinckei vinckei TaxID=54757 RepID=A0A449C0X0_PLAVN|nr:tetratricopeptide repeat protein, putative [Plasmodium vinckei vinckei]VEV59330.1 tetratricopeptide repeat protein, putative [Plasmodium vinckei vinckei]
MDADENSYNTQEKDKLPNKQKESLEKENDEVGKLNNERIEKREFDDESTINGHEKINFKNENYNDDIKMNEKANRNTIETISDLDNINSKDDKNKKNDFCENTNLVEEKKGAIIGEAHENNITKKDNEIVSDKDDDSNDAPNNTRNCYSDDYINNDEKNSSESDETSEDEYYSGEESLNDDSSEEYSDSDNEKSSYIPSDEEEFEEDEEEGDNTTDNELSNKDVEEIKEMGNEHFKKCDYKNAIYYYSKALKKCKDKTIKSILYSNRAACNVLLKNWNLVIDDCTKSINCDENYVKSYIRRSNAYEHLEKYNDASNDLNKAISIDSSLLNTYEAKQKRLKILAEQQLSKEKEEMVGKLKDFGNMLLGKVGLSLDNFEVQKNPNNDGSFNIQFKQNK